jgi:hypothetical protein
MFTIERSASSRARGWKSIDMYMIFFVIFDSNQDDS